MRDIVTAVKTQTRIHSSGAIRRTIIMHIGAAVSGLLLARAPAFGQFLPFGTALCAGVKKEYSVSALTGVILGSIYSVTGVPGIVYIGAAVVAVALKWVLSIASENEPINSMISAAVGAVFCGICSGFSFDYSLDCVIRTTAETLLAAGVAYFLCVALPLLNSGRKAAKLSMEEMCAALSAVSVGLLGVTPYTIFTVSPARVASCVLILCAARYGREVTGAVCGIVFGFAMSITGENVQYIVGAYALAGLLAGIFSRQGSVFSVTTFVFGVLMMSLGFYKTQNTAAVMIEAAIAVMFFVLMPKKLHLSLADFFAPAPQLARVDSLRRNVIMRMKFASDALTDVSNTVDEVAGRLSKMNMPTIYDVFVQTENKACENCGLRIHCYETLKDKTYEALLDMTRQMRKKGRLTAENYPEKWQSRCLSPEKVADALYEFFAEYDSKCEAEMRIAQIRSVVSDQMSGLSDMLYDMSEEMNVSERYDTAAAECIDAALRKMGLQATDVCCKLDASEKMSVEICVDNTDSQPISKLKLIKLVNNVCARRFNAPCIVNAGSKLLITMTEKTAYKVDVGVAQFNCNNEKLCGDSYAYFNDSRGRMILLLSDGMGCGGRAAVDSSMVSGLMERLLKAGFGFECSLKLLNSAMMFKSRDESLATVDITSVDLYSGQTDFYKAGCPETVVLKGKKTGRAKCKSCPAGIIRDVNFDKTTAMLDDRDIIVMMSDGVCDSDCEWIDDMMKMGRKYTAQQLAESLAQAARRRRDDGHEDDITVMVGIINKSAG